MSQEDNLRGIQLSRKTYSQEDYPNEKLTQWKITFQEENLKY